MTRRRPSFLIAAALLAACWLIYRVQVEINGRGGQGVAATNTIYLRNPELIKQMSLGYECLLADLYWIRAVQYYGRKTKALENTSYELLEPMLNLATTLDPQMTSIYRFGAMFLSEGKPIGAGEPLKAIELMEKGIQNNPGVWRLHFDKGFVYLFHLRNHKAAANSFLEGLRQPGAPKWLESLAAYSFSEGGELETARYLWNRELEEAENEAVRENARNHLNSLQMDEDRWRLEFLVAKHQEKSGRALTHLDQLVAARWLRYIPKDPSGVPYEYDRNVKGVYPGNGSKVVYLPLKTDTAKNSLWNRLEKEWQASQTQ